MRLHSELLAVSLKQNTQKIESELSQMTSWASAMLDFHNRQGSLDIKYLETRYAKGKTAVNDFCQQKHLLTVLEDGSFESCQAEMVRFMTNIPDAKLGCKHLRLTFLNFQKSYRFLSG